MTDSRESIRRRAFRDQAPPAESRAVPLTELCIIRGCLCLRDGANLCPAHQHPDLPREDQCH